MKFLKRVVHALVADAGTALEALEPRAMMSVTAAVDSVWTNGVGLFATVHYRSNQAIDLTSIGNGDVTLSAPARQNSPAQPAYVMPAVIWTAGARQSDGSVTATYFMYARGYAWDWADTGQYTLSMNANEVYDASRASVAAGNLASYWLWFTTPRADYQSGTLTGSSWNFSVIYSDDNALNLSTIGNDDIEVYGPGGWQNQIARAQMTHMDDPVGNSVRVFYSARVAQVAASWLNRGHYDIIMRANQVFDAAGNSLPAFALASYWYWNDRPAVQLISSTITASAWNFSVRYSDDHGINVSSIGNGDIQGASLVGTPAVSSDGSVVANYTIPAPSGGFSQTDGSTALVFNANQVFDIDGNAATDGYLIPQSEYTTSAPAATVTSTNRVNANTWDVIVRFTDTDGMNLSSLISGRAVEVQGARNSLTDYGGYRSSLSVLTSTATTNGYYVTFRLIGPASGFASGQYYLRVRPDQVFDNLGHTMASQELLAFTL
jgi:hypothetical protein